MQKLIRDLDAYQSQLYPVESLYHDSLAELIRENVYFISATVDGQMIAIGSVKKMAASPAEAPYGELKRMYVVPAARGSGIAKDILIHLEQYLVSSGIYVSRLETGIRHDSAIRFYERNGYTRCGRYGSYPVDPLSCYMEKNLKP